MKNLPKDIHVEALTQEHGAEIIETFKKLGVDTDTYEGSVCRTNFSTYRYYGIIKGGEFSNRDYDHAKNLVTLEELKSYLEEEVLPELPNGTLMYVSNSPIPNSNVEKRYVIGKKNGKFVAWRNIQIESELCLVNGVSFWKYAQPITETTMTVAEIEAKLGITNLKIIK